MINKDDLELILDEDYLVRYHACARILRSNGINVEVPEVRRVFRDIITEELHGHNLTDREIKKLKKARDELVCFIENWDKPLDYNKLDMDELNELLLDASCIRSYKMLDRIKELVEHGADINACDEQGFPAFFLAYRSHDHDTVEFFLKNGADCNRRIFYGDGSFTTAWLNIVACGELDILKLNISHGALVNDSDSRGNTALMLYLKGNYSERGAKYLLSRGADVTAVNDDDKSALHVLCSNRCGPGAVRMLIKAGSDVNAIDSTGKTALHYLAGNTDLKRNADAVSILVENGSDPDIIDKQGDTPLLISVRNDRHKIAKALIQCRADTSLRDKNKKTAYDIALEKGYLKTAVLLNSNARKDYKNLESYKELVKTKQEIISRLKNGQGQYMSDKEGYSIFRYYNGGYVSERYDEGQPPPSCWHIGTDREALEYLYSKNRYSFYEDETELDIYRRILNSIRKLD